MTYILEINNLFFSSNLFPQLLLLLFVAMGTTMMHMRAAIAIAIRIFSLQFLQYIIFSSSPALCLNSFAWSFNVYDFFSKSYNCTWLSSIFLVLSCIDDLNFIIKSLTSSKFSLATEILSTFFRFSYFLQISCIWVLACIFKDDYF